MLALTWLCGVWENSARNACTVIIHNRIYLHNRVIGNPLEAPTVLVAWCMSGQVGMPQSRQVYLLIVKSEGTRILGCISQPKLGLVKIPDCYRVQKHSG